jgi:hypothetical protein
VVLRFTTASTPCIYRTAGWRNPKVPHCRAGNVVEAGAWLKLLQEEIKRFEENPPQPVPTDQGQVSQSERRT